MGWGRDRERITDITWGKNPGLLNNCGEVSYTTDVH